MRFMHEHRTNRECHLYGTVTLAHTAFVDSGPYDATRSDERCIHTAHVLFAGGRVERFAFLQDRRRHADKRAAMRHWLFKTEPEAYSIERLQRERMTPWTGVRNFQARNNMQEMQVGDLGLFYHSSIPQPAAVGVCRVVKTAYPDFTQFERDGEYFDGRAKPEKPIWMMVDVEFVEVFARPVTLAEMRAEPRLTGMALLKRGQRLSVQPVTSQEWTIVRELARAGVSKS